MPESTLFELSKGGTPLLVSMPHSGILAPPDLIPRFTENALPLPDTDRHVERLYDFASELGATVIQANYSRYVVDLNRPPDGATLYAGANNTELCPLTTFDYQPIYRVGDSPDIDEIAWRVERYWKPYHDRLTIELDRIVQRFGYALLFDAHSIRSRVPRFFNGELPSFSLGTGGGLSADPWLVDRLTAVCAAAEGYTAVCNGRFKGGHITRHFGAPDRHIHAVQMELSQDTYMNEQPPYEYDEKKAGRVRPTLRAVLKAMLDWGREIYG
ncbi:MAG: N-formylglutamate deformylase [Sphingomonadales bacterium]